MVWRLLLREDVLETGCQPMVPDVICLTSPRMLLGRVQVLLGIVVIELFVMALESCRPFLRLNIYSKTHDHVVN